MNRFSWDRLPAPILRTLQRELGLAGDAATSLRRTFGDAPSPALVQRVWEPLRDRWLATDAQARQQLVVALRSRRLGDLSIDTTRAAGQMAYLRSCRNGAGLQAAASQVLAMAGAEPTRPRAWRQFLASLTRTLGALGSGQYLVLVRSDRPWFVQFAGGPHGMRAEMVSNAMLADNDQLPRTALRTANRLGWKRPAANDHPNLFRSWPMPVPHDSVARLAVDTIVDVFGTERPTDLRYSAFDETGATILLPELGLGTTPTEVLEHGDAPTGEGETSNERNRGITARLLEVLREATGDTDMEIDDDGDIPVRQGSAVMFVRVVGDPPLVRVFSPVLSEVGHDPGLLETVNQLNHHATFVKWHVHEAVVVASIDLFGAPVVEQHVLHACRVLGESADQLDEQLQRTFGGRTFLGDYKPPVSPPGVGGYL